MTKAKALGLRSKSEPTITIVNGRTPADISRGMPRIPTGGYRSLYDHVQETTDKRKASEETKEKMSSHGE